VFVALMAACMSAVIDAKPTVSMSMIREINSAQKLWRAGVNKLTVKDPEFTHSLLGVSFETFKEAQKLAASKPPKVAELLLPDSFDVRDKWPQCKNVVEDIRDQGDCGSCWAFGAAESMSDRECFHNNITRYYSVQDILACGNNTLSMCGGCTGGLPWCAFKYWNAYGVVSEECAPYNESGKTPDCVRECKKTYTHIWDQDKMFGATSENFVGEQAMQEEIMKNGSIEGMMTVFDDLYAYKSGVYKHVTGGICGVHCIKIVGWGVEDGVKYWTIANSWGDDWGDHGFFKLLRGEQECAIETISFAGIPRKP